MMLTAWNFNLLLLLHLLIFFLLSISSSSLQRSIPVDDETDDDNAPISPLTTCPPPSIVWPCSCALSTIRCYHGGIVRLEPILQRVAQYLQNFAKGDHHHHRHHRHHHFLGLELDGLAHLRHLPANFTAGLSFEWVALKNLSALASIHPRSLPLPAADSLQQLSLEGTTSRFLSSAPNLHQLRQLVASLPSLERLYLDLLHLEGTLPRHFLPHHRRLTDLSLNFNREGRGRLTAIADQAFYLLPALRTIDLYGQRLTALGREAFHFSSPTFFGKNLSTALFLEDNLLTDDSFPVGVFASGDHFKGRQLTVHLGGNRLTTVREDIFRPLLLEGSSTSSQPPLLNKVDFGDSRLVHSCANRWVAGVESRYRQFLAAMVHFNATEHRVLVALDLEDYASLNCSSSSSSQ